MSVDKCEDKTMERVVVKFHLKKIREERGLSLRELAKVSGVAKRTICHIEAGDVNPLVETMCRLAKALDVQAHELFDYE